MSDFALSRRNIVIGSAIFSASYLLFSRANATSQIIEPNFIQIPSIKFPKGTTFIKTRGWSVAGLGGGVYVTDALAKELAPWHPQFCTRSANGQYFRLIPQNGMITVEQAGAQGDFAGDAQSNDSTAFQAAINYARAIGVATVGLTLPSYAIWTSERTTDPDLLGRDGHGLVIAADQRVRLVGLGQTRARIRFRAWNGRSFDGDLSGTDCQIVNGEVWRGSGVFVETHSDPANSARSEIILENLLLDGGLQRNLATDSSEHLIWDITHKGIFVMPDRLGGSVTIRNAAVTGWRGESVFCSNDTTAKLTVRNSLFADSNGQGLNPNSCMVDVDTCEIRNCYIGIEGWTGELGGRIVRTIIKDCGGPNSSGCAFSLQGGMYGRSDRSLYYAPTPVTAGTIPFGEIDIRCKRSAKALVGWWLKGRIQMIETPLVLGEPQAFNDGSQRIDLDLTLTNQDHGLSMIYVAGGLGGAGAMLTDNCTLRVTCAEASGFTGPRRPPVMWYGSLGPNIAIDLDGFAAYPQPCEAGQSPDFTPVFA